MTILMPRRSKFLTAEIMLAIRVTAEIRERMKAARGMAAIKENKENKVIRATKASKVIRATKETKEIKAIKETKVIRATKETKVIRVTKETKVIKVDREMKTKILIQTLQKSRKQQLLNLY